MDANTAIVFVFPAIILAFGLADALCMHGFNLITINKNYYNNNNEENKKEK